MADLPESHESGFARLVLALQPHLSGLVFVGGWAHRLHTLHELAGTPGFEPLMTRDADIAADLPWYPPSPDVGTLLREAGFREEPRGEDEPPITHYRLAGSHQEGFTVEFIVPQRGSGYKGGVRTGSYPQRDDTIRVAGVSAQKLRHVDLLTQEPWDIRVCSDNGFPLPGNGVMVKVANPVTFMLQKLLISRQRAPDKRPKDLLYIHDTLRLFAGSLDQLRELWQRIAPDLSKKQLKDLQSERQELFAKVDERIIRAADIARGTGRQSPPSPERLLEVCRVGLNGILGPS